MLWSSPPNVVTLLRLICLAGIIGPSLAPSFAAEQRTRSLPAPLATGDADATRGIPLEVIESCETVPINEALLSEHQIQLCWELKQRQENWSIFRTETLAGAFRRPVYLAAVSRAISFAASSLQILLCTWQT